MHANHRRGRGGPDRFGRHSHADWRHEGRDQMSGGRGGRGRMFEQGDLKVVVLHLLNEHPRHGYEIIKAIEDLAAGEYSPSPGVIYPTLTLLEELGQAVVTLEQAGKKQYGITQDGAAALEGLRPALERILDRLRSAGSIADARRTPELQRSIQNFKTALHLRLKKGDLDPAALRRIADAIDRAAVDVERS